MGNSLVIFKVSPEDVDVIDGLEACLKEIKEGEFKQVKREPLAFGMEVLKAAYVIPDKTDGALEKLENAIRALKGVSQVDVEGMTLL